MGNERAMGVELLLLLLGLGLTGVVLTNLLSGETLTERPSTGARAMEVDTDPGTGQIPASAAGPRVTDEALPTLPHEPPHLWGHPAPLARLLALIVASSVLLCAAFWGLGWLAVQAIARAIGG